MGEIKRTPGPWTASGNGVHLKTTCVATTHMEPREQRQADAAFIARACNGFDGLVAFTRAMLECAFEGTDADGGSIQDLAVTHGLIAETKYDPEKHGPSMEADPGDPWFELIGPLAKAEGA